MREIYFKKFSCIAGICGVSKFINNILFINNCWNMITQSRYTSENLDEVMNFLRKLYITTGSKDNWYPDRFENTVVDSDDCLLWRETSELVGVSVAEGKYWFIFHNGNQSLIELMITAIEKFSKEKNWDEPNIILSEGQEEIMQVLVRRNYEKKQIIGWRRFRDPRDPVPVCNLPAGYRFRIATPDDFEEIALGVRKVFGHKDFGADILEALSTCSFYRDDLDFLVETNDSELAAFCTFRIDEETGIINLEPLGTLPDHRGKGIAKAMLSEGLLRIKKYNPKVVYIGGAANTEPANKLYDALGYIDKISEIVWVKKNN